MTLRRRELVVALGVGLAGCVQELGTPSGEGDGGQSIASDVGERVFVEARTADLPTPEEPPGIGVTNEGVFQYTAEDGAWVPFDWTRVLDVDEDGRVRVGYDEAPVESIAARTVNGVPQVRERAVSGSGTKADPFVVPEDLLDDYHGLVNFGRGWFEADGLVTDADFDYAEQSVYLQGDGIRTTTLQHGSDAPGSPTILLRGAGGNFGGVRDMTVYGAGEGDTSGSANIVETDGGVIDYQFENVIFRWGGGDVLRIETSGSGTRVQNAWLENAGGWAFHLRGGERVKVDNVHTTGTVGGIKTDGTLGNFSNLTLTNLGGGPGVVSTSTGNQFTNVVVADDAEAGFVIRGGNNTISNVYVSGVDDTGLLLGSTTTVSNVIAEDFGSDPWESMFDIHADDCRIQNAVARGGGDGRNLFRIREGVSHCHLVGVGGPPGISWECSIGEGAIENVIDDLVGVPYADVNDHGIRTLVNRWGTNEGAPDERGEWKGHAEYAGLHGATIWDTTTDPWKPYTATPDGSWRALASG